MTVREQKGVFTFAVIWMFGAVLWATVSCPPPRADELWALFALSVTTTLVPAFALLGLARKLSGI